jgi:Spy/CpxP family protein refolding chaperone
MGSMKTHLALLILLATTAATPVFAQGPPPGGPPRGPRMNVENHISTMTTLLSLNAAQQAQATKIYTDAQTAAKTVSTNMQTARTSLNAAIKKNDLAAIEQLSTQIGNYQAQLTSINSKAEAAFYASLTPDQQTKLDTLHANRAGFGGPGSRGPREN